MLGGVCSGIADLRGSDPNVIRFWVVLPVVFGVPMVAVYLWVWLTFRRNQRLFKGSSRNGGVLLISWLKHSACISMVANVTWFMFQPYWGAHYCCGCGVRIRREANHDCLCTTWN